MNELPIFQFSLLNNLSDDFLPKKGSSHATGWDVRSREDLIIRPNEYAKIHLGIRVFSPPGWWLELRPRSSSFTKKRLHALYGVIDEDYEGELVFACQYLIEDGYTPPSYPELKITAGEAVGQIIPIKRQEMIVKGVTNEEYETLCKQRSSSRGTGGFGSTGH